MYIPSALLALNFIVLFISIINIVFLIMIVSGCIIYTLIYIIYVVYCHIFLKQDIPMIFNHPMIYTTSVSNTQIILQSLHATKYIVNISRLTYILVIVLIEGWLEFIRMIFPNRSEPTFKHIDIWCIHNMPRQAVPFLNHSIFKCMLPHGCTWPLFCNFILMAPCL